MNDNFDIKYLQKITTLGSPKMLTAAEILEKYKYLVRVETDSSNIEDPSIRAMIEFAKNHVKVALKEALNNVKIDMGNGLDENGMPSPHFALIKDSILNAYNLDNIK